MRPDNPVALHQIASSQQQVEEVHRALSYLQPLILINAAKKFGVQDRRKVGIGPHLKVRQRFLQSVACGEHLRSRDPLGIHRSTALAPTLDVAVASQFDKPRLEPIEIWIGMLSPGGAQLAAQSPDRLGIHEQVVANIGGAG